MDKWKEPKKDYLLGIKYKILLVSMKYQSTQLSRGRINLVGKNVPHQEEYAYKI